LAIEKLEKVAQDGDEIKMKLSLEVISGNLPISKFSEQTRYWTGAYLLI
jgi:hypothetical protein